MSKRAWCLGAFLLLLVGCCSNPPEADVLRNHRKQLIESIRPALVDALEKAVDKEGKPLYIDAYRTEKVNLVDEIIAASARVAPTDEDGGKYTAPALPWAQTTGSRSLTQPSANCGPCCHDDKHPVAAPNGGN